MSLLSVQIMGDSTGYWDFVGEPAKAAGFYGQTIGLHTISYSVSDFIGRIGLQGSLASDPTEDDWFDIILEGQSSPWVQIDATEQHLNDNGINTTVYQGQTGTIAYTFLGNFTYVRAVMNRSTYIETPVLPVPSIDPIDEGYGYIRQVLMNF